MATLQLGLNVRNAMLDAIESNVGVSPEIEFRTGAMPANCGAVATGNLLARDVLPSDWLAAAAAGVKGKAGAWTVTGKANITPQSIGYFRIYASGSPDLCVIQGDVTAVGGGGAMTVDNISLGPLQVSTVQSFNLTAPNA